ncbi:peptidase [Massilia solisilvae]|uniref:Peptidase n=1 Tax=Massilia solisilvae TaxID=1811225 RepID=A0ABT2BKC3_9BURK|nr:PA domain-containing protein [Massilia solisilvae]MCS0608964.1 peptidase [Massilia solisilvae]
MKTADSLLRRAACALALSCCAIGAAQAGATITIINTNEPGVGFNDPTPAAPVGGNTGTTLGQQRLIAFQRAADIWGATLNSNVPIRVDASFVPLSCTANSAVLGSAGANEIWSDFDNAPKAKTWYPSALASKLQGSDVTTPDQPHIVARFNSRLGLFDDCMPGSGFYLGLDNQFGNQIDLVTVLLHELGHGLGFQTFTDDATGEEILGLPSIWDYFLVDNRSNKAWVQMTDAERAASAISGNGLSWNGPIVTAAVPQALSPRSNLAVSGPAAGDAAGNYSVGDASFGPALSAKAVTGQLMPVVDQGDGTGTACTPLSTANKIAVRRNIALVDRGTCSFVVKARMVQDAGAIGMIVADNQPGDLAGMSGSDPAIKIPSVRVTQADGATLKAVLQHRSRTRSGVVASLGINPDELAGADAQHRMLMYTPTTLTPGSSVSHYTTDAKANQLMEPAINGDLSHEVTPPRDLTYPLLRDIGW